MCLSVFDTTMQVLWCRLQTDYIFIPHSILSRHLENQLGLQAYLLSELAEKLDSCNWHVCFSKTLRIWELDLLNRKIRPTDTNLGQLKRVVKCLQVSGCNTMNLVNCHLLSVDSLQVADDDEFVFCGTTSGDILQVCVRACVPTAEKTDDTRIEHW